ncbi:hypothetical protein KIW84_022582 [Lathyrus oleraceus]|uniref:Transposase-associated domain-containing protein n=1 Tax=Pisum sativum TaxID=3888 RepID=A0A9D5BA46_PEA|nr:hypothetical protein KIW84_022582 [Pisum sativum]
MYDRTYPGRRGLKPNFEEGVKGFITWAFAQECCLSEGGVRCPCLKCECRPIISDPEEVERHLKRRGKTKDNEKARKDMEILCNRKELELKVKPNGKLLKPKANYSLTSEEAKAICRWLNELRMPDGYASNLARCADSSTGKLHGMKSHDCHVFMERLLPIAFSSLPKHVLNPLTEISQFFRDICASKLRVDDIVKLDKNIPVILFFGIPGRPSGKKNVHWLTQKELQAAHVHVLINCVEVKPYLEAFNTSYFQSTGEHPNTSDTHAYFPAWFKEQLSCAVAPTQEIIHLRNLSRGPVQSANEWHTYFVNGYKFHTQTWTEGKKTINSGVFVKGVTDGGEDDFYGTITHIYELVYNYLDCENKVVLFYCDWMYYMCLLIVDKMPPRTDKGKGQQRPRIRVCEAPQSAVCPPPQSQVEPMSMTSQHFMPLQSSMGYPPPQTQVDPMTMGSQPFLSLLSSHGYPMAQFGNPSFISPSGNPSFISPSGNPSFISPSGTSPYHQTGGSSFPHPSQVPPPFMQSGIFPDPT